MLDITWAVIGITCGIVGSWAHGAVQKLTTKHRKVDEFSITAQDSNNTVMPTVRIALLPAMNGRILEVATKISHPHAAGHFDWKSEMYIVPEDQKLSEAVATVMLMKGLSE